MILPLRLTRLALLCAEDLAFELRRKRGRLEPLIRPRVALEENLELAMEWLRLSHRKTGYQGSAKSFSYLSGWRDAYPETTGYIACTFIDYARFVGNDAYLDEAGQMLDFLCDVQQPDGGILGGTREKTRSEVSIIFNTGMVMEGWIQGYEDLGNTRYRDALVRASDFLVRVRESRETWLRHSYHNIPHAYHSRVAWQLLAASKLTGDGRHRDTAVDVYSWVLEQQDSNGYFHNNTFTEKQSFVNMHGLAYTLRGLLEGYLLEGNEYYLSAVTPVATRMAEYFETHEELPSLFDEFWTPRSNSQLLTGIAQMSIVWMKLSRLTGDARYWEAARKATDLLRRLQLTRTRFADIRGAVKGSQPIWGGYSPLKYPNWATKFFADALMLRAKMEATDGRKG